MRFEFPERGILSRACCVAMLALVASGCGGVEPETELAEARNSFEAGEYGKARVHILNVLQDDPENGQGLLLRGQLAVRAGDAEAAERSFERARAAGVPLEATALGRARALRELGRHDEALALLDDAAEVLESQPAYWTLRGRMLTATGALGDAEDAFDRAAELGGETRGNLIGRAQLADARQDPEAAESLYGRALERSPGDPEVLSARAASRAAGNRLREAAADLDAAAEAYAGSGLQGRAARTLAMLVQVYLALGDSGEQAASAAEQLAELAPGAPTSMYAEAAVAYAQGRFNDAVSSLQRALADRPDDVRLLTLLGAAQLALGNLGQAEQALLRARQQAGDEPAVASLIAETRLRQQRPEAALESLDSPGLAADEQSLQALQLRARAYLQAGQPGEAVPYLQRAASRDPGNQQLRMELARAYMALGRDEELVELLEQSLPAGNREAELNDVRMLLLADLRAGDVEQARGRVEQLVAENPESAEALMIAAAYYRLTGEHELARDHLERAVQADAAYAPARMALAEMLVRDDDREQAEQHLEAVLAEQPLHERAWARLAELMAARGAVGEAAERLASTLEGAGEQPNLRLLLARLYLSDDRRDDAETQVELAAEGLTPAEAEPATVLALARAQLALERPDPARAALRQALEANPRSLPLRTTLGAAELAGGDADAALTIATELQSEHPDQASGYLLEGETRLVQRRYDEAVASFGRAREIAPNWRLVAREMVALRLADRTADIETLLEDWLEERPDHLEGRMALADYLLNAGHTERALEAFRAVLELDSENVVALNNAAWLAFESGSSDALALAERAHELAPDNPAVLDTLGWILARQNREQDGIVHLERAAELAPEAAEIQYHLGATQAALGDTAAARATLEALLAEAPEFDGRAAAESLLESL